MKNCCILYNTIALYRVYSVACSKQRKFNFKQKAPLFALSLSRSTKVFIVWKRVEPKDTSKMCIINASQKKGVSVCVCGGEKSQMWTEEYWICIPEGNSSQRMIFPGACESVSYLSLCRCCHLNLAELHSLIQCYILIHLQKAECKKNTIKTALTVILTRSPMFKKCFYEETKRFWDPLMSSHSARIKMTINLNSQWKPFSSPINFKLKTYNKRLFLCGYFFIW